ncbi:di-heme oxidoredictase family protein [Singulisphaera acidiphila]|uniref:Putative thiol oxidoreductase n=1 Tax=Singulisphaera acidiphila (strain ATCC BAA-1392 / DSM 18658 / VKM B-2454 / MOB10) TaxID=886293 RepID=L0DFV9_SINAD|nr:di-heme oxidoredictase family protein [Singulisphaera acidiphila]AGA27546.1 putative thiol oxidoreductase [Singulisphaera acidiphila DSM 18658]
MAARSPMRPAHWIVLALVLAPAWKVVERLGRSGPKAVSAKSVAEGRILFNHDWTVNDPLTKGDGLGPVFNATSCLACHNQGGAGGGGPVARNVTVYGLSGGSTSKVPPSGVVHQKAIRPEFQETLNLVHSSLPHEPSIPLSVLTDRSRTRSPDVVITQRNTPALFGDGLIDAVADETLLSHQREHSTAARLVGLNGARDSKVRGRIARLADGRIGRFGWKLEFATLNDFVKAACANELGLSNPGRPQAVPLGQLAYKSEGTDLTDEQCVMMTDFIRDLAAPTQVLPSDSKSRSQVEAGHTLFAKIGCADCHSEKLGPIAGIFSDMLLHDMGVELESSTGYYGSIIPQPTVRNDKFAVSEQPTPAEWRTAPLWGVADSAPYLHDGRAASLEDAIVLHGGEASDVAVRFKEMSGPDRDAVIAFLKTLRAPAQTEEPKTLAVR